jgi:hypothetical protein
MAYTKESRFNCWAVLCRLILLAFTLPVVALPQVPNSINGRIVDPGGMPLSGIEVTLEQSNAALKRSYTTDRDGMYHFDCLAEGIYSLTFRCPGFITERMEDFTYRSSDSLRIDRKLQINPAVWDLIFEVPSKEPGKSLTISVKDSQSSKNIENAEIVISDANGILAKSPTTDLCGLADIRLESGKRYSVRVSKEGFETKVINFDMPNEEKRLDIRLDLIK